MSQCPVPASPRAAVVIRARTAAGGVQRRLHCAWPAAWTASTSGNPEGRSGGGPS